MTSRICLAQNCRAIHLKTIRMKMIKVKVVSVASPTVYGGVIENGVTGVIFNDPATLRDQLCALLADPMAAMNMAEAARAYVGRERMMAYQIGARRNWYWSIWNDRERLHTALLKRVPELGPLPVPAMGRPVAQPGETLQVASPDGSITVPGV